MSHFRAQPTPRSPTAWVGILAGVMIVFADGSAAAEGRTSVYTSIRNVDCRFERGTGTGSEEAQTKRCPGLATAQVVVDAGGTSSALGFAWPGARPRLEARGIVSGWSLGERLEWRGAAGSRFKPDSVIVRVVFNQEGSAKVGRQVLAILKVKPGVACLRGLVDMTENRNSYERARRSSDDPSDFACGTDSPHVEGTETEWTALVIENARRHTR